ncbi:MAG: hypothetical protein M3461_04755 [Pseudomonadota bacterium]|nr:hypothetical protein [Pseudomonadota bacterium]
MAFDELAIGTEVSFVEEAGEKDPQASNGAYPHQRVGSGSPVKQQRFADTALAGQREAKLLCSGFPQLGDPIVERIADPLREVVSLPFSL